MNATHWTPGKKKWKKIKALGDGGAPIFWRVLQRTQVAKMPDMDNFSSAHSFTIE